MRLAYQTNARVGTGVCQYEFRGCISRAVIDDHALPVHLALPEDAAQCGSQCACGIVSWEEYRDKLGCHGLLANGAFRCRQGEGRRNASNTAKMPR